MKKVKTSNVQAIFKTPKVRFISFMVTTVIFGTSVLWLFLAAKNGQLPFSEAWQNLKHFGMFLLPFLISIAVSELYTGFFIIKDHFIDIWYLALAVIIIPVFGNIPDIHIFIQQYIEVDAKTISVYSFAIPLGIIYFLSVLFILFKFKYTPPPEPTISDEEHRRMMKEKYEMFVDPPKPKEEETDAFGRPRPY